jgi:AraC-like DNA-binding protein
MKLTNYPIHPQLKNYIEKLWVLENDTPVPATDARIIIPNGLVKMVIPFKNGLKATLEGTEIVSPSHCVTLIGLADIPSTVVDVTQGPSGCVGIEFNPAGAYRFFNLSLHEIKNQVNPLAEVLGKTARDLQEKIANAEHATEKVLLAQNFLLSQFAKREADPIFEFCIQKIIESRGTIQIAHLEKKTGYSARWLNMKFFERIGISPKNLCSILRFQQVYHGWARTNFNTFEGADIYTLYHDQSHFIKDFKRFTGHSPGKFQILDNEFGRIFYRG